MIIKCPTSWQVYPNSAVIHTSKLWGSGLDGSHATSHSVAHPLQEVATANTDQCKFLVKTGYLEIKIADYINVIHGGRNRFPCSVTKTEEHHTGRESHFIPLLSTGT